MDADGEKLECVRIANDALGLVEQVSRAGADCEVVIEATYGWYWAVDLLGPEDRALGRARSGRPLPRRRATPSRLPSDRQAARQEQGPRRGRPQTSHARLLRASR